MPPAWAANKIELKSEVINAQLIPTILINEQTVMRIQDRGNKKEYESNFDRAEKIYTKLLELEKKGIDISTVRARRYKTSYFGQIQKTQLFMVSPGDSEANGTTPYRVAIGWVENIRNAAIPLSGAMGPEKDIVDLPLYGTYNTGESSQKNLFISALNLFTKNGILGIFYLIILSLIQVGIAAGVYHHFGAKKHPETQDILSRLKKLETTQQTQAHDLHTLKIESEKAKSQKPPIRLPNSQVS